MKKCVSVLVGLSCFFSFFCNAKESTMGVSEFLINPIFLLSIWDTIPNDLSSYNSQDRIVQKKINNKQFSVYTYAPLRDNAFENLSENLSIDLQEITPFTHKWIEIILAKEDGSISQIKLIRSNHWIKQNNVDRIGANTYIDIPELGIYGWARIEKIIPCQLDTRFWVEERDGEYLLRPITAKYIHTGTTNTYVFNDSIAVQSTATHPIYSVSNKTWKSIAALKQGELVASKFSDNIQLTSIDNNYRKQRVYNLGVYKNHNFLISDACILAHNNKCPERIIDGYRVDTRGPDEILTAGFKTRGLSPDDYVIEYEEAEKIMLKKARFSFNSGNLEEDAKGYLHRLYLNKDPEAYFNKMLGRFSKEWKFPVCVSPDIAFCKQFASKRLINGGYRDIFKKQDIHYYRIKNIQEHNHVYIEYRGYEEVRVLDDISPSHIEYLGKNLHQPWWWPF